MPDRVGQSEASPSVIEVLMDDGSWRAAVALKPGDGEHDGWVLAQDGSGTNTLVWWCAPGEWRAVSMPDQPVGQSDVPHEVEQVWEVERDRHGVMFSGPLEVGECRKVVSADALSAVIEALNWADAPTTDDTLDGMERVAGEPFRGYTTAGRVRALYSRERIEANRLRERLAEAVTALRDIQAELSHGLTTNWDFIDRRFKEELGDD